MDARSAPERIGEAHLPDQPPDFRPHAWPAGTPPRFPAPEAAKTCTMPADNGFRLYDREGLQNTRRDPIQADEDHTIEVAEDRALRRPSMQHIQLMAQSEYLCLERRLRAKQPEEHPPDQVEQVTHRTFITRFGPSRQADGIYDSDRRGAWVRCDAVHSTGVEARLPLLGANSSTGRDPGRST